MRNAWFVPYHLYSVSKTPSPRGIEWFTRDAAFAAAELDVEYVIVEDYYENFVWGEFTRPWHAGNLRAFIRAAHDVGIKFLPYLDATELAMHGQCYPQKGREWGAKNRWGKIYCGYSSVLYPSAYYLKEHEFFLRLMCPASGWADHLVQEVETLLDTYEIDGIYVDRWDYRVPCFDHLPDQPNHFAESLVPLMERMQKAVKTVSLENILIMNDSCMEPDSIMAKLYRRADAVLSELLLADMNPWGIENILATNWGDLVWTFRRWVRPFLTVALPRLYQTGIMTRPDRLQAIITRIRRAARDPAKPIFLFSHRTGPETLKLQKDLLKKTSNTHLCYHNGIKPLVTMKQEGIP